MPRAASLESESSILGEKAGTVGSPPAPAALRDRSKSVFGLGLGTLAVFAVALAALVPTVGDFGFTWDEPAYRYSQVVSVQWWEQLGKVRSWDDFSKLLEPDELLFYWPYGRYGINFHPPLAGQLNLATFELFGGWLKDIPARRLATVIEFALTITVGFHFMARRYGVLAGLVMGGSLLCMPRLYGQAHLIDTDVPALLLWVAVALAFWKGLHEDKARRWRVLVGVLLGLAFVEKMNAVTVLLPVVGWLVIGHLPVSLRGPGVRAAWIDGLLTSGAMLLPLGLAFLQILMLQRQFPPPQLTNLLIHRPLCEVPGVILAIPLLVWIGRRLLARIKPASPVWGVERPALETWTAVLAFAPLVSWLGNPAWWRDTLPRLAHYYAINVERDKVLPPIQIIYFGQIYEFSLPWHNGWVLMGITVPVAVLAVGLIGVIWGLARVRRDRLPLFFFLLMAMLPAVRMFKTPAHDGVRLFLPSFFFLACFAGMGAKVLAGAMTRLPRMRPGVAAFLVMGLIVGPAALALSRVHPYELSYYNEIVGGPRGAWEKGFELTYWYDAYTPAVIRDLNGKLPLGACIDFLNEKTVSAASTFQDLQLLGELRSDIVLGGGELDFPYVWLLTQDSKASAFTRVLFAMRPWYANEPEQLDGARVATVNDPLAVARAWALRALLDTGADEPHPRPAVPDWVRRYAPFLSRLWGEGLVLSAPLGTNKDVLRWSRSDPEGLVAAARAVASRKALADGSSGRKLVQFMGADRTQQGHEGRLFRLNQLLDRDPEALVDAVKILNAHRDEVVKVMTRYGYTDPKTIGGYLDRDLAPDQASIDHSKRP
jgi:4-amino-4-deoxy-L-arabinose transferase-like glycosyltransferase